jgi:hypothetical protein
MDAKKYIQALFAQRKIVIDPRRSALFDNFVTNEANRGAVQQILENQKMMMEKWALQNKIHDILDKPLLIPNATVGKPYEALVDFIKLGINDLVYTQFDGLEAYGLVYNNETETIKGTPSQSGDFKIIMKFRVAGEADNSILNEKKISLIINANPKSLWKHIPSTQTPDNFWKPDNVAIAQPLGSKHIVVASKRGRSHANVGSFRDDDFRIAHSASTGWSVVCVADGAGSAKLSRQGSKLACDAVLEHVSTNLTEPVLEAFDTALTEYYTNKNEETSTKISHFVYNHLSKAAHAAYKKIEAFAAALETPIKDFHSTLIFTLFKQYDFGYAILTFGVGDCPIGLINKDMTTVKLMNWLDVGEFGGGTRFITMPEIFSSDTFLTRFGFTLVDNFSYLFLMTDGIYDPKFVVEANLEKIEKWNLFIEDLKGNNEEKITVNFSADNKDIAQQLSDWMDFWSPGNHDDRTLAIVF